MNHLSSTEIRVTETGLFIPLDWLIGLPENLCFRRFQEVLIIETSQRAKTREQLAKMVGKLRQVADDLGVPEAAEIASLVEEVRSERARDPKDQPFIDLATISPRPDFIITGDKDFEQNRYGEVPVISATG